MRISEYEVSQLDCPSEEQMIKMRLSSLVQIVSIQADIPARKVTVFHTGNTEEITQMLATLNLGSRLLQTENTQDPVIFNNHAQVSSEKKLLWAVLGINFFFFLLEMLTGWIGQSLGLLADSLDMLADSFVYALALLAVGGSIRMKKNIAIVAGSSQMLLAVLGFMEVINRFMGKEAMPYVPLMIIISALALVGNAASLYLLQKSKSQEAHMQASMIFTSSDVVVNLGVILAGGLVYVTGSPYPDLVVGTVVFIIVARGAIRIFKLSR